MRIYQSGNSEVQNRIGLVLGDIILMHYSMYPQPEYRDTTKYPYIEGTFTLTQQL